MNPSSFCTRDSNKASLVIWNPMSIPKDNHVEHFNTSIVHMYTRRLKSDNFSTLYLIAISIHHQRKEEVEDAHQNIDHVESP